MQEENTNSPPHKPLKEPSSPTPIPRYSDKFKEIIAKSNLERQLHANTKPHTQEETSNLQQHNYFFFRVKTIGVGAHSFVYLVQQQHSNLLLAEKSVTKQHAAQISTDLLRQIKYLSFLDHKNIIKLYHVYPSQTHLNLILQFAQDSLFALKQRFGIFKEKQILEIVKQLLHALVYLHSQHIIHADVKLQNIMIANGTIKLCDFGLAHQHPTQHMQNTQNTVVGTMEYLPPQYAQGVDSGPARDIWAVGILAFEMAVGKHPFEGLKENQKWTKLVKNPANSFLSQFEQQARSLGAYPQKVLELVKGIFLPWESRWSAQKLLQLSFFNPSTI